MANETTAKFSVDISDLKKGIQEANRQIRLANAEFKAASASMDKWSTSTSGLAAKIEQTDKVLAAQKKILESYEKEMELVIQKYGENSKEADNAKIKYENQRAAVIKTEKSLADFKTALENLEKAQKESAEAANKQDTAYEALEKTISAQENALSALKSEYSNAVLEQGRNSKSARDLASQISELSGELDTNKKKLAEADDAADDYDQSLNETTSGGLNAFSVALGNLAANVISNLLSSMQSVISDTIEVGKTFESSMSNVASLSGATAEELELLKETAKEYGSTTQFSASEAADALGYMALAGWDAKTSAEALGGVLDLAAASGMDLAAASDMVTDYMSAFNLEAKDSSYFADLMAYAQANANTSVEQLGEAFKNSAANMNAAGQDIETVTSFIAMMANQGLKGSEAGTALTAVMRDMTSKMKDGAIAIGDASVQVMDAEGNYRDLTDILADIEAATDGMGDAQKASALQSTFTADSIKGLNLMLNAGVEEAAKFEEELRNSSGTAEEMAAVMNDNLNGDLTALNSKLEGVQIAIYEKFEPALRSGVDVLDKLLDALDFVVDHSTEFLAALAAIATGVGAYVAYTTALTVMEKGWQALTVVTKLQAAAQAVLNAVMAANPIGLVIAAIAGLVAAFILLWNKSEAFRNFWIGLWETIKEVAGTAWEAISGFFQGAYDTITSIFGSLADWFSGIFQGIKDGFAAVADWFNEKITAIKDFFTAAFTLISEAFTAFCTSLQEFFQPVVDFFSTSWSIITQLAKGCWEAIKIIWTVVSSWYNSHVIQPVRQFFEKMWNAIKGFASTAWNGIKSIWSAVSNWFKSNVIDPIKNFFETLWTNIKDAASNAWEGIKGVWNSVANWFNSNVVSPVTGFFSGMWDNVKNSASQAWDGIKSVFSHVSDWFHDTFYNAWSRVMDVFSAGGQVFSGIKEGISNAFKTIVNALIRGINNVIAVPFNAINNMLDKIRNVTILKMQPFSGLISRFNVPTIPELASGGVLARGQVGLLEGNGAEAVIPLENNKKWLAATAKALKVALTNEGLLAGGVLQSPVVNNTYTFTQNNTSPKALDALSIYRSTNSLLFRAQNEV
jgi:TP901 family phage tail tape measure protein